MFKFVMIHQTIAGVLAGTGWLIGWLLYKWTKEELNFIKKLNLNIINTSIIAAIFAASFAWKFSQINAIIVFAGTLLFGSLYGEKPRNRLLFFAVHVIVFLLAFYLAQVF